MQRLRAFAKAVYRPLPKAVESARTKLDDARFRSELAQNPPDDPVILRVCQLAESSGIKLNVGCGTDYRDGFINIDGSSALSKVDRVVQLPQERLDNALGEGIAAYILAHDVVEHVYHWEAVEMLGQFYGVLMPGGGVQIRVPDCEYILSANRWSIENKLIMLFGGQDVPRQTDSEMDASRQVRPDLFCHKYGWTMHRLHMDLNKVGFHRIASRRAGSNFITYALKEE